MLTLCRPVLPIMEYACPVWSGGPVAKLIHLQFTNRFEGVIIQICLLSRRGLTFTLWYFFTKFRKTRLLHMSSLMPLPSSTSGYQLRREPYPVPAASKISSFIPRSIILWNTILDVHMEVQLLHLFPIEVCFGRSVVLFPMNYEEKGFHMQSLSSLKLIVFVFPVSVTACRGLAIS